MMEKGNVLARRVPSSSKTLRAYNVPGSVKFAPGVKIVTSEKVEGGFEAQ